MADSQLQTILNSGGITSIYLGGTATGDKVLKKSEVDAFDNSATSLAATTKQDALVELANVGLSQLRLVTPYTAGQIIGTTPIKLSAFDTVVRNINGAVTAIADTSEATPAHKFTTNKGGLYSVYGTVVAEFSSSTILTLVLYKNGVQVGVPLSLIGRGALKPVMFTYLDIDGASAADYFEVYAYCDSSTSVLITSSSMTLERKPLS